MVCASKKNGGLGVLDLQTQNESLLVKHLHKFFNKVDTPWVQLVWHQYYANVFKPIHNKKGSFWWRDILKMLDSFKGMASVTISDGSSCFFWSDVWNDRLLCQQFPKFLSFAKDKFVSVQNYMVAEDMSDHFYLPLSVEAYDQYTQLAILLESIHLHTGSDRWSYILGYPDFASSKAYTQLMGTRQVSPVYSWLWKSDCQHKTKVFF
jgi:hypothetical protein